MSYTKTSHRDRSIVDWRERHERPATAGARQEGHRRRRRGRGPEGRHRHALRGHRRQFVVQAEVEDGRADRPQGRAHRHQEGRHGLEIRPGHRQGRRRRSARASTSTSTISRPSGGERHGEAQKQRPKRERQIEPDASCGWRRENGRVGVRNHVVILPLDDLSNAACEAVANNIKGTLAHAARLWPAAVRRGPRAASSAP